MTKEWKGKAILVFFVLTCLVVSPVFASIQIQQMQFSFEELPYYSNKTLGFSQATSFNGDVAIYTSGAYAYTIADAVVTLSNMPLVGVFGTKTGTFAGPATLTVTGSLIKNSTAADLTGNVTLLVASMDTANFVMTELFDQYASGSALFTPTGGALFVGVADGSDLIKISNFGMGLWGWGADVLFGNNSMTPPYAGVQIDAQIPEPLTVSLLSMGLLILSHKRKNA